MIVKAIPSHPIPWHAACWSYNLCAKAVKTRNISSSFRLVTIAASRRCCESRISTPENSILKNHKWNGNNIAITLCQKKMSNVFLSVQIERLQTFQKLFLKVKWLNHHCLGNTMSFQRPELQSISQGFPRSHHLTCWQGEGHLKLKQNRNCLYEFCKTCIYSQPPAIGCNCGLG